METSDFAYFYINQLGIGPFSLTQSLNLFDIVFEFGEIFVIEDRLPAVNYAYRW